MAPAMPRRQRRAAAPQNAVAAGAALQSSAATGSPPLRSRRTEPQPRAAALENSRLVSRCRLGGPFNARLPHQTEAEQRAKRSRRVERRPERRQAAAAGGGAPAPWHRQPPASVSPTQSTATRSCTRTGAGELALGFPEDLSALPTVRPAPSCRRLLPPPPPPHLLARPPQQARRVCDSVRARRNAVQ